MISRFTVLASGSAGNASLLEHDGFGLLIDCGIGPRIISERLFAVGLTWSAVSAVLLTHTHRDHWSSHTIAHLRRMQIPLFAHAKHHDTLAAHREHTPLRKADLLRDYPILKRFSLSATLSATAVEVPHDSDPTFAFRLDGYDSATDAHWSLGFASDLGQSTAELVALFSGVDALAVEFNHDVDLQTRSRRPRLLIQRVLGKYGHLSNRQAGELARTVAQANHQHGLQFLAQLHLSRECNRPELAEREARSALQSVTPQTPIITTSQHLVSSPVLLKATQSGTPTNPKLPNLTRQPLLPGMDGE